MVTPYIARPLGPPQALEQPIITPRGPFGQLPAGVVIPELATPAVVTRAPAPAPAGPDMYKLAPQPFFGVDLAAQLKTALKDAEVRKAARSYMMEGAAWGALAVFVGLWLAGRL